MELVAMYLPQFHRVKENDEWWGEGFTDWIPTKNAKPLFDGQYQPHEPVDSNYYNLLDKDTMIWQANLMEKYGIDGVCMYHYWFKNGRRILEKPMENLLKWKDINMNYCIYWANESWKRSWSNVQNANVWQDDDKRDEYSGSGLLLDQQYGDKRDWDSHFDYMLPFFHDNRYIKIDGKPVLILYRTYLITCLSDMIHEFRRLAKINGFPDLFIIGAYATESSMPELDGVLYHEPTNMLVCMREGGIGNNAYSIEYDDIVERVLAEPKRNGVSTFFSCFTGFDDTPRRGLRGNALRNSTPQKYQEFLAKTIAKNRVSGSPITFINAWNEWGEGMHLEPDKKFGYAFLEATLNARSQSEKYMIEMTKNVNCANDYYSFIGNKASKFEYYTRVLDRWMELRENKICIEDFFSAKDIHSIAIYGCGAFGRHLYAELKNSSINVCCFIDRYAEKISAQVPVYLPNDRLPECDAIVITTFWITEEIKKMYVDEIAVYPLDEIIMLFFQDR